VLPGYSAIAKEDLAFDYPGNLHQRCHEKIDDLIAVFANLGFPLRPLRGSRLQDGVHFSNPTLVSRARTWVSNEWQGFYMADDRCLFQVKAFLNGNLHLRFLPEAIKALNIEAGRLLGWLRGPSDVVTELGYSQEEADQYFGSNQKLGASSVKLLTAG
jgi:hypothetical protein